MKSQRHQSPDGDSETDLTKIILRCKVKPADRIKPAGKEERKW